MPTEKLVYDLWGEQPPRTATTALQNAVSQLRKLLGSDRVVTKPPGYLLRVEPEEFDLTRFERLVAAARAANAEARSRLLRGALELWSGPPLADFTYEAFAQGEIRRLEEFQTTVLEDRIEADLELGRHGDVVGELEALVAEHPLRERLRGQLMLALYRSGRQADALGVYQEGRAALVEELGIEPSPELQRLHSAILRQEATLEHSVPSIVEDHYGEVVKAIIAGRLVPVLGTGASVRARPEELASRLAEMFECPSELGRELTRISQYVAVTRGVGPLYDELHAALEDDDEPGPVHRFLAELPALLRDRGAPHQLIVTTSYDESLETAFREVDEEFDVVVYLAAGRNRGKFLHLAPDGSVRVVDVPNAYGELSLDRRTVIVKIHGQVDRRPERAWESFVVSEDDYIGYLAQAEISNIVPVTLAAKLRRSHFLFLGYALREWNLRVFLHRIWADEKVGYRSWAVVPQADPLERDFWRQRDVDMFDVPLDEYLAELKRRLVATPARVHAA